MSWRAHLNPCGVKSMKSAITFTVFGLVLTSLSCHSPTPQISAPRSDIRSDLVSIYVEKYGEMRKQLEEGIDRQVKYAKDDARTRDEVKRLDKIGDELETVSSRVFLERLKSVYVQDFYAEAVRKNMETDLSLTIAIYQARCDTDRERESLKKLNERILDVCLVVFAGR